MKTDCLSEDEIYEEYRKTEFIYWVIQKHAFQLQKMISFKNLDMEILIQVKKLKVILMKVWLRFISDKDLTLTKLLDLINQHFGGKMEEKLKQNRKELKNLIKIVKSFMKDITDIFPLVVLKKDHDKKFMKNLELETTIPLISKGTLEKRYKKSTNEIVDILRLHGAQLKKGSNVNM